MESEGEAMVGKPSVTLAKMDNVKLLPRIQIGLGLMGEEKRKVAHMFDNKKNIDKLRLDEGYGVQ